MAKGRLEPGPKREVAIGKLTLTLANEVPVEWELDDEGRLFFKSGGGEGVITIWDWITAYKVTLPPGESF